MSKYVEEKVFNSNLSAIETAIYNYKNDSCSEDDLIEVLKIAVDQIKQSRNYSGLEVLKSVKNPEGWDLNHILRCIVCDINHLNMAMLMDEKDVIVNAKDVCIKTELTHNKAITNLLAACIMLNDETINTTKKLKWKNNE